MPSRAALRGQLPLWLSVALVAPLLLLLGWSYFLPIARLLAKSVTEPTLGLSHYARLLNEPLYAQVFFRTIWIAVLSTFFALVLAYPVAMLMARHVGRVATIASHLRDGAALDLGARALLRVDHPDRAQRPHQQLARRETASSPSRCECSTPRARCSWR